MTAAGAPAIATSSGSRVEGRPSVLGVSVALCMRGMRRLRRRPSLIIPTLVMPVFFVVSFSGAFSSMTDLPGYGTDQILDWMAPYAILQGASFAGMGAAGIVADDITNGFFDRLLLAPGGRRALLLGPLGYAAVRSLIPTVLVLLITLAGGLDVPAGVLAIVCLLVAAVGVAVTFGLVALTIVLKMRSMRALMLGQVVVFVSMFLSIGQVPLELQTGWLHAVSRVNPITNVLRLARQGFIGDVTWAQTWPGLLALALLWLAFGSLASRQLRRFA